MSHLHKSEQYDLVDMFNDTSSYLDDNYIHYPEFEKHISYIHVYPTDLQLSKATTSDKETYYLDLLAVTFISAFTTNVMTLGFQ